MIRICLGILRTHVCDSPSVCVGETHREAISAKLNDKSANRFAVKWLVPVVKSLESSKGRSRREGWFQRANLNPVRIRACNIEESFALFLIFALSRHFSALVPRLKSVLSRDDTRSIFSDPPCPDAYRFPDFTRTIGNILRGNLHPGGLPIEDHSAAKTHRHVKWKFILVIRARLGLWVVLITNKSASCHFDSAFFQFVARLFR